MVRDIPEKSSVYMVGYEGSYSTPISRCRHTLQRIGVAMPSKSRLCILGPHKMLHHSQASRSTLPFWESMYDHKQHTQSSLAMNYEILGVPYAVGRAIDRCLGCVGAAACNRSDQLFVYLHGSTLEEG